MRWQDLDGLGHVNHAVVLTYLEEGRDAFLREHGIGRDEYVVGRCAVSFNGEIDPGQAAVTVSAASASSAARASRRPSGSSTPSGEVVVEAEFGLVLWDPAERERAD